MKKRGTVEWVLAPLPLCPDDEMQISNSLLGVHFDDVMDNLSLKANKKLVTWKMPRCLVLRSSGIPAFTEMTTNEQSVNWRLISPGMARL